MWDPGSHRSRLSPRRTGRRRAGAGTARRSPPASKDGDEGEAGVEEHHGIEEEPPLVVRLQDDDEEEGGGVGAPKHRQRHEERPPRAGQVEREREGGEQHDRQQAVAEDGGGAVDVNPLHRHEVEHRPKREQARHKHDVYVRELDLALEQQHRRQRKAKDERARKVRVVDHLLVELGPARPQHRARLGDDVRKVDPELLQDGRLVLLSLAEKRLRKLPARRQVPLAHPLARLGRAAPAVHAPRRALPPAAAVPAQLWLEADAARRLRQLRRSLLRLLWRVRVGGSAVAESVRVVRVSGGAHV
mmetsp:Transcript_48105/g.148148  ORF Transcript_48105/g.148148 Transcript_48105/m.148148 type:complete len:302 (-) Transcript_48105:68-973(-)